MKLYICSMRDLKSAYVSPVMEMSKESAVRNFMMACKNEKSVMNFAPADFRLECFGTWDNETGLFDLYQAPEILCDGGSLRFKDGERNV